jgi:predicted TIM-barrel fold metal-dependent hydrolase
MRKPTGRTYKVISADSHVVEAPDLWERWLEPKFRERAPQLVKDPDGGDAWLYNRKGQPEPLGLVCCVNIPRDRMKWTGYRYGDNIHPSCHDGRARLEILDIDGVDAEFLYPPQRAILSFAQFEDKELIRAGIEAYNRWLIEGFCSPDPKRLFPVYQIPNLGIDTAVAEIKQAAALGCRTVAVTNWPSGNPQLTREDDAFWKAAEELEMPVAMHFGLVTTEVSHKFTPEAQGSLGATNGPIKMGPVMVDMIFSGVFDRFPGLQVSGIEVGCGWVPHVAEMMDDRYWRNRARVGLNLKHLPSHYVRENFTFSFIVDQIGVQVRHAVGLKAMLWSTDFPHHGNSYPYSRESIEQHFVNVPEVERHAILAGNAVRLYGLE